MVYIMIVIYLALSFELWDYMHGRIDYDALICSRVHVTSFYKCYLLEYNLDYDVQILYHNFIVFLSMVPRNLSWISFQVG